MVFGVVLPVISAVFELSATTDSGITSVGLLLDSVVLFSLFFDPELLLGEHAANEIAVSIVTPISAIFFIKFIFPNLAFNEVQDAARSFTYLISSQ